MNKSFLWALGITAFVASTSLHAFLGRQATIFATIGAGEMVVQLDRYVLISDISTATIGTSGTDTQLLGEVQISLLNNQTSGTYFCYITSEEADSNQKFRVLYNTDPNKYVMLQVTSNKDSHDNDGTRNVFDGTVLRYYVGGTDPVIDNGLILLNIYAIDDANNSTSSGTYECFLHFGWTAST